MFCSQGIKLLYFEPGQLIDTNKGNKFQESFEQFGGLRLISRFSNLLQLLNNQLRQDSSVLLFFLKGE